MGYSLVFCSILWKRSRRHR